MDESEIAKQVNSAMERTAAQRARERAKAARWDLDVAVFFFAILIIIIILLSQGIRFEVIAPAAVIGLAMGWLMGWRKGKQKYELFYNEELSRFEQELEEMIAENIKKALRERRGRGE